MRDDARRVHIKFCRYYFRPPPRAVHFYMGRHKTTPGTPCANGHPYVRRGPHGCRDCRHATKRRQRDLLGLSVWRKRSAYLEAAGAAWIASAHVALKKRSPGQARATRRELLTLWRKQDGRCGLTGLPITGAPHLDHKIPVSIGGASTIDNLHWVHPIANMAKNNYSVDEFQTWLLAAADSLRAKRALEELF